MTRCPRCPARWAMVALVLAACSDPGQPLEVTIGGTPDPPAGKAPLTLPPDFDERPEPGAGSEAVLRADATRQGREIPEMQRMSPGQAALLVLSGADQAPADIRARIDREVTALARQAPEDTERLLVWSPATAPGAEPDSPTGPAIRRSRRGVLDFLF